MTAAFVGLMTQINGAFNTGLPAAIYIGSQGRLVLLELFYRKVYEDRIL